ncbi:MAG TPA: FAD-dependent oxidoreductase [Archangium sp.]|uniref:NAD(P)/FAD-dependent oxidoreductase n=1 Tax=Archangium sp. TaxID=1872627 RepID=UPI002E35B672|nr:FAD-dependent oxidoreductase [Archangium sp.]HEX5751023.1 FAD-dependent oxidoreductase [Archangium sp.]
MNLIIGSGIAAVRAVEAMRGAAYEGRLVLVSAEDSLPYEKPPLSKGFLLGRTPPDELLIQPESFYRDMGVELMLGQNAESLDTRARQVRLSDGRRLHFEQLLIATGASARRLPVPGAELDGVLTLRTRADAEALKERLSRTRHLLVVGAGLVGLEAAASARQLGMDVTVVESSPAPLQRLLGSSNVATQAVEALHRANGVTVLTSTRVHAFEGKESVERARLSNGETLACELVLLAVGVQPNTGWLLGSGLLLDDGVMVDDHCRTRVPGIWAAGDVTRVLHPGEGSALRLESYGSAHTQGIAAGQGMAGRPTPALVLPGAGSEQYGVRLQLAGRAEGADQAVVRGSLPDRSFVCFFLADRKPISAFAMNRPREMMAARKLIQAGLPTQPELLQDEQCSLAPGA